MATYSDRVVKSVTHYQPNPLPLNEEDLGLYVTNELKRLGDILFNQATFRLERIHAVPDKPESRRISYFGKPRRPHACRSRHVPIFRDYG